MTAVAVSKLLGIKPLVIGLGLGFKFPTVHIDHIFIYQLPIRELMIPNVIDPNKIKMTSAGMVATAHLTIRTTNE
jgi:hypothetical protein